MSKNAVSEPCSSPVRTVSCISNGLSSSDQSLRTTRHC